jgi:plastocyanin
MRNPGRPSPHRRRPILRGLLLGVVLVSLAQPVRAQDGKEKAGDGPVTRAEFAKLQNDVREQRQLIIDMLQTEQQRYDMLLHLLQGQGGGTPFAGLPAPAASGEPSTADAAHKSGKKPAAPPSVERRSGTVEGKVSVSGGALGDVYVYVENVHATATGHKGLEIKQEGRQFNPRVAVVQSGTNVVFPNLDSVYHNVFSNSPRNTFDLGTYQSGDKPRSVTVTGPGVVEVFCNLHQKMSAKILVAPSALYTKVRPDGTFRIENVPSGARRLVAWSPDTKPEMQKVDVVGATTQVSFSLEHQEASAHTNKFGQAYGSYRD